MVSTWLVYSMGLPVVIVPAVAEPANIPRLPGSATVTVAYPLPGPTGNEAGWVGGRLQAAEAGNSDVSRSRCPSVRTSGGDPRHRSTFHALATRGFRFQNSSRAGPGTTFSGQAKFMHLEHRNLLRITKNMVFRRK